MRFSWVVSEGRETEPSGRSIGRSRIQPPLASSMRTREPACRRYFLMHRFVIVITRLFPAFQTVCTDIGLVSEVKLHLSRAYDAG